VDRDRQEPHRDGMAKLRVFGLAGVDDPEPVGGSAFLEEPVVQRQADTASRRGQQRNLIG
jgi:hypothetical protein